MAFQISVLAVGYVRWTGSISVPATNSDEVYVFCKRAATCPRESVDWWYRDGHRGRLLRHPDIPSGHIVVSRFVCALSDLRLVCVAASLPQVEHIVGVSSIMVADRAYLNPCRY